MLRKMWKLLPLLFIFSASSVRADLIHRLSTSTSLTVGGASTAAERLGSTYAVSGSNIKVGAGNSDVFGGLTAGSATAAATIKAGTYDINTTGSSFSFSESWTQGDAIPAIGSGVDVTSGVVADMPAFGNTTTTSGGVADSLAGTILSSGVMTIVAGGANTSAVGQFVSEITVK